MHIRTTKIYFLPGLFLLAGCATDTAHIQIVERPSTLEVRRYQETFDEAYYDLRPSGQLRLVLRRHQPAALDADELTQTLVIESIWHPEPGVSIASDTQINGMLTYGLHGRKITQTLTGAGSLFYYENKAGDRLTGNLPHVTLESSAPQESGEFLRRIELSGDFYAHRDPAKALALANEVKRIHQVSIAQLAKQKPR